MVESYQVILSTDGKHSVIVSSDLVNGANEALAWAKATYNSLVQIYGLQCEQYRKVNNGSEESVPVCAVHHVAMVRQNGKHGPFWSCHQRNADGNFCSYKPSGH